MAWPDGLRQPSDGPELQPEVVRRPTMRAGRWLDVWWSVWWAIRAVLGGAQQKLWPSRFQGAEPYNGALKPAETAQPNSKRSKKPFRQSWSDDSAKTNTAAAPEMADSHKGAPWPDYSITCSNSPEGRMGLGLLALGQMPQVTRHAGTDGPLGIAGRSSKEQSRQRMAGRSQGAPAQGDGRRPMPKARLRRSSSKPTQPGFAPLMGDQRRDHAQCWAARILASFDMPGYAQAMMGVNPMKGMQPAQSLQKELPVDKINPEKFTPASLAKFCRQKFWRSGAA